MSLYRVNLGGEGEVPGVPNQQGRWVVLDPGYRSSQGGLTFAQMIAKGDDYSIADNTRLPLPDACCDEVLTESVPIDIVTYRGPGVQTSEVHRILKRGGVWTHDKQLRYTKP